MNVTRIRIFVASVSDVAQEQARLPRVIEDLRPLANSLKLVLELVDWHKVVPDLGRPQQVILDQVRPNTWDVFIGIIWHRFGTPPKRTDPRSGLEYQSGTEEEFSEAYRLWQSYKRPRVMFYWCKRDVPYDAIVPQQFRRVKSFFAGFAPNASHPGLYQRFTDTESFEHLVRQNLSELLLQQFAQDQVARSFVGYGKNRIDELKESSSFNPLAPDIHIERSEYKLPSKQRVLSLAFLEEATKLMPDDAKAWYNKGVVLGRLKRYKEALPAYNKAIKLQPDYARAWYNKGVALGNLNRYKEALPAYNKAIKLQPDDAKAWHNKGSSLGNLNRYKEALPAYNKAIKLQPDYARAWRNKGVVLGRLNRYKEALP
ncbi:MAG: tetratricopeptide repeat protein, partial [Candidatus Bathyarchaeia archaeon]